MLTGKRAFGGENAASVIAAILEREPAPINAAPPLDRVVRKCLAKDADHRFQCARDLKAALTWALEQPPATGAGKQSRRWWVAVAATSALATVGILGGWAVWQFHRPPADEQVFCLPINPPEGTRFVFGIRKGGIALSPDGRPAAFVASGEGKNGLWVRPLDGTVARLLVAAGDIVFPFWSPDGKSIGFFAGGKLQRVDLAVGSPFIICDVVGLARGASWSSDGLIIYATLGPGGLFQVRASGGAPSPLTILDASRGEGFHVWPQVLPGGRFFFCMRSEKPENTGIYAASFARPTERVHLLTTNSNALYAPGGEGRDYLLWLRGGTLLAQELDNSTLALAGEPHPIADQVSQIGIIGLMNVAVSARRQLLYSATNGSGQFAWLDRKGRRLSLVGEPGEYSSFRLSPDGRRILAGRSRRGGADLWLLDVERGTSSRFTDAGSYAHTYPTWSPDGRIVVFYGGIPFRGLVFKDADGAGSAQPLESSAVWSPFDWSRDGRFILYATSSPGTGVDLWILPMTSEGKPALDAKPRAYIRTPFYESQGRFSPEKNPRWVAYVSDESGRYEVYIDTFPERRHKTPISTGGGLYPQWGAGGRELYYVSPDFKLMVVSLKLEPDSVEPSAPRELFPLPAVDTGYSPYEVAPDGQRFLVCATPQQQAAEPLTVIVNWPALLRKGSPTP
jgi:Tol biopolymer transport system component